MNTGTTIVDLEKTVDKAFYRSQKFASSSSEHSANAAPGNGAGGTPVPSRIHPELTADLIDDGPNGAKWLEEIRRKQE